MILETEEASAAWRRSRGAKTTPQCDCGGDVMPVFLAPSLETVVLRRFTSQGFNYSILGEIESRRFQRSPLPRAATEARARESIMTTII